MQSQNSNESTNQQPNSPSSQSNINNEIRLLTTLLIRQQTRMMNLVTSTSQTRPSQNSLTPTSVDELNRIRELLMTYLTMVDQNIRIQEFSHENPGQNLLSLPMHELYNLITNSNSSVVREVATRSSQNIPRQQLSVRQDIPSGLHPSSQVVPATSNSLQRSESIRSNRSCCEIM